MFVKHVSNNIGKNKITLTMRKEIFILISSYTDDSLMMDSGDKLKKTETY